MQPQRRRFSTEARTVGRELRPDGVVAALALLLDAREAELVARVDRRRAADRAEHDDGVRAGAAASSTMLAIRVTSWLPTNVSGTNESRNSSCRVSDQASSQRLASFSELQTAFQSSYCVTESTVESGTNAG